MTFKEILKMHAEKYPEILPQDLIKLAYQGAFGAEHLIGDYEEAKEDFKAEWERMQWIYDEELPDAEDSLYEWVSPNFARINMDACKEVGLPAEWIFTLFMSSAEKGPVDSANAVFMKYLEEIRRVCREHCFSFDEEKWSNEVRSYLSDGVYPVRHSERYRKAELPAYRIIDREAVALLRILQAVNDFPDDDDVHVIAIDGRSAAGKSSLSLTLQKYIDAAVIHTDDFYLPERLRTEERYAVPGGNIHFERFFREIIPGLKEKESFSYRPFDCETMAPGEERIIQAAPCRIVEGAYSHHPIFGDYADLKIFLNIDEALQTERLKARNGEAAEDYKKRWIPLEEAYIDYYGIEYDADIILQAEDVVQLEEAKDLDDSDASGESAES